jgi:hypothetical protein
VGGVGCDYGVVQLFPEGGFQGGAALDRLGSSGEGGEGDDDLVVLGIDDDADDLWVDFFHGKEGGSHSIMTSSTNIMRPPGLSLSAQGRLERGDWRAACVELGDRDFARELAGVFSKGGRSLGGGESFPSYFEERGTPCDDRLF